MDTITIPSPTAFLANSPLPSKISVPPLQSKSSPPKKPRNNATAKSSNTAVKPNANGPGVTKQKQSKSRNGCSTCKAKRLKCDETKPTCQQCHKRNVECGGYKKDYKWRDGIIKVPSKPKKSSQPQPFQQDQIVTFQANEADTAKTEWEQDAGQSAVPTQARPTSPFPQQQHEEAMHRVPNLSPSPNFDLGMILPDRFDPNQPPSDLDVSSLENVISYNGGPNDAFADAKSRSIASSASPQLLDLLEPGTDLNQPPPPDEPRPPNSPRPYQPSGWAPQDFEDQNLAMDDEIEEIQRSTMPGLDLELTNAHHLRGNPSSPWAFRVGSPAVSVSSGSSSGSETSLIARPILSQDMTQMLTYGFINETCGILSIKNGANENPWRTMVLPLASTSEALKNAISSLTAFHIAKEQPEIREAGVAHMVQSFKCTSRGFQSEQPIALLATILCLAFAESWDQETSTGIQHLRGAKLFIVEAIKQNQGSFNPMDHARLRFLVHTWVYMDVLARLTSFSDNDGDGGWMEIMAAVSDPIGDQQLDPLLGCAATLFPHIGQFANLVSKARKTSSNDLNLIGEATELKDMIERWSPPDPRHLESPEDITSQVQHSIQTAEAYRWATLLYLHRAFPEIPSKPAAVVAKTVLRYLATVPTTSRTTVVHIYPLLVASCEIDDPGDRKFCEDRWAAMTTRLRIGNVDKCVDVVKEVWRRRDEFHESLREHADMLSPTGPFGTFGEKKRAYSADDAPDVQSFFGQHNSFNLDQAHGSYASKRRAVDGSSSGPIPMRFPSLPEHPVANTPGMGLISTNIRRRSELFSPANLEVHYTIQGSLHWLSVMADRDWEGKFLRIINNHIQSDLFLTSRAVLLG